MFYCKFKFQQEFSYKNTTGADHVLISRPAHMLIPIKPILLQQAHARLQDLSVLLLMDEQQQDTNRLMLVHYEC